MMKIIEYSDESKIIKKKKKKKIQKTSNFKLFDYVLSKFGIDDDELWWPGQIVKINNNNTYNINYFDGDFEKNKSKIRIKKLEYEEKLVDDFVIISYKK